MDRKIRGEYNVANMVVELFTTLAGCHTHLSKWLDYEKGTIFWKGGDHPLEPACDNIPELMMAIRDLIQLLSTRDSPTYCGASQLQSLLAEKVLSSKLGRPPANELASLLADGCLQCSEAIYEQHQKLLELEHHWEDYGTEDCAVKAGVIRSRSRSIDMAIQRGEIEPAALRRDLSSHALAIPLGLTSNKKERLVDPAASSLQESVIPCPNCSQRLRAPRGKHLKMTCPRCRHAFVSNT